MADYTTKDGKYLPEGIYMEATALSATQGLLGTYHSYLVYRDGQGDAEVIRGGSEPLENRKFDLTTQVGVSLSDSEDAYYKKDNKTPKNSNIERFDQKTHLYAKLDIGDRDPKAVWAEMVNTANKINPDINYNIKIAFTLDAIKKVLDGQASLAEGSAVCHSVVGTVLESSGMTINAAIAKMREANKDYTKTITEDSFAGIRTNLFSEKLSTKDNKNMEKAIRIIQEMLKEIEELKKYILSISDARDSMDKPQQLAQASSSTNLSLEQLVKNEIGQDMPSIEELRARYSGNKDNKDNKNDNDNLRTMNA